MTTESQAHLATRVQQALRSVKYPPYSRDIVSFGLLQNIAALDGVVRVELAVDSAKPETAFQIQHDVEEVLSTLPELKGFEVRVEITCRAESHAASNGTAAGSSSDEPRLADAGFDSDPLIAMMRPDLAPGVGYGEDGPEPIGGPRDDRTSTRWTGAVPVFQWEIDPSDAALPYGEHEIERGNWTFRLWWQVHPADLVFASISALAQEGEGLRPNARQHPVGHNVAVNLVYDLRRQGVVAIYGTALDFRPFVEVFLEAFGISKSCSSRGNEALKSSAVSPQESQSLLRSAATQEGTHHEQ